VADFNKAVCKILREHGCHLYRQGKGSHEIWCSPLVDRYFTVPAKILSRHTANEVLKQAGLAKAF
jgi:predicted RNA binding protein YcfA (HicA-like mRNA interferase family)